MTSDVACAYDGLCLRVASSPKQESWISKGPGCVPFLGCQVTVRALRREGGKETELSFKVKLEQQQA